MLKRQPPKFVGKYRKTPDILDEWYGYQEFFSHSLALIRNGNAIFAPSNSYFTEKTVVKCPF